MPKSVDATESSPLLAGSSSARHSSGNDGPAADDAGKGASGDPGRGSVREDGAGVPADSVKSPLAQFCERLDIVIPQGEQKNFMLKIPGNYETIRSEIRRHRWIAFAFKFLAVLLVLSQLALGIIISIVTSLQGKHARLVVIILGGVNSFVGGLAGILQYWGQPTRESRYYASLKMVQDDVESLLGKFKNNKTRLNPWEEGDRIWDTFKQARADAWSNEPIIWLQNTKAPNGIGDHPTNGATKAKDDGRQTKRPVSAGEGSSPLVSGALNE